MVKVAEKLYVSRAAGLIPGYFPGHDTQCCGLTAVSEPFSWVQNLCPDQHGTLHNQECYQKVWPDIPHIISTSQKHTHTLFLSRFLCLRTWRSCLSPISARWVICDNEVGSKRGLAAHICWQFLMGVNVTNKKDRVLFRDVKLCCHVAQNTFKILSLSTKKIKTWANLCLFWSTKGFIITKNSPITSHPFHFHRKEVRREQKKHHHFCSNTFFRAEMRSAWTERDSGLSVQMQQLDVRTAGCQSRHAFSMRQLQHGETVAQSIWLCSSREGFLALPAKHLDGFPPSVAMSKACALLRDTSTVAVRAEDSVTH